jgi:hypothetical protein
MRHVVLSYAASPAHSAIFALLKPTAYNGSWLPMSEQSALHHTLLAQATAVFAPGVTHAVRMLDHDEPFARYLESTARACPSWEPEFYGKAAFARQWGALAIMAWDLITAKEKAARYRFEQVLYACPDIE